MDMLRIAFARIMLSSIWSSCGIWRFIRRAVSQGNHQSDNA
jgi:hypothetical protein